MPGINHTLPGLRLLLVWDGRHRRKHGLRGRKQEAAMGLLLGAHVLLIIDLSCFCLHVKREQKESLLLLSSENVYHQKPSEIRGSWRIW